MELRKTQKGWAVINGTEVLYSGLPTREIATKWAEAHLEADHGNPSFLGKREEEWLYWLEDSQ